MTRLDRRSRGVVERASEAKGPGKVREGGGGYHRGD